MVNASTPSAPQAAQATASASSGDYAPAASSEISPGVSINTQAVYPFCLDGKKIIFGPHRGTRYWDLTGKYPGYCSNLISNMFESSRPAMAEYKRYLLDRGYPTVKAPQVYK